MLGLSTLALALTSALQANPIVLERVTTPPPPAAITYAAAKANLRGRGRRAVSAGHQKPNGNGRVSGVAAARRHAKKVRAMKARAPK